jgi:hypothetical protein
LFKIRQLQDGLGVRFACFSRSNAASNCRGESIILCSIS